MLVSVGTVESGLVRKLRDVFLEFSWKDALKDSSMSYTYGELDEITDALADELVRSGVVVGDRVGIYMERSLNTVISIIGILKVGAAYVPLDPKHPEERNAYILIDSGCKAVLVGSDVPEGYDGICIDVVSFVNDYRLVGKMVMVESDNVEVTDDLLSYLIYTSGTTGTPKGTLLGGSGVLNLADWMVNEWGLCDSDVVLQFATYSFDASVMDTFGALLSGATLYLLEDDARMDPMYFSDVVDRENVSVIPVLPTVFFNQLSHYVDEGRLGSLRVIGVGGEALPVEMVRKFKQKFTNVRLFNLYGPTEITVVATAYEVTDSFDGFGTMPIGEVLPGLSGFVVSDEGGIVGVGGVGELLIGAVGIARGYLNNEEKTREVFVSGESFGYDGMLYRSGDLVRVHEDGVYEFVDRKDLQVKLRGHRIEIGEIESHLMAIEGVRDVVVVLDSVSEELVAFYTSSNDIVVSMDVYLSEKVPYYMVPSRYILLDEIPMTPTGKVDRKMLTNDAKSGHEVDTNDVVFGEMSDLERLIADTWVSSLGLREVSREDDFFEVGGHSLKVIEVLTELKRVCRNLTIKDFFELRTIEQIAQRIEEYNKDEVVDEITVEVKEIRKLVELPLVYQKRSSVVKNVLLTGATGYLGSHVLHELLTQHDDVNVFALVRGSDGEVSRDRLADVYRGYFGIDMVGRVNVICGDMSLTNLGMDRDAFIRLSEQLDAVLHCAADVRHFGEREHFEKMNIGGTRNLLALGDHNNQIEFHHVSTVGVVEDIHRHGFWDRLEELNTLDDSFKLDSVYTDTKLEAERIVLSYVESGNVGRIYRMGNLIARYSDGVFQRNIDDNAFYRSLKLLNLTGLYPKLVWKVDMTPVDFAARVVVSGMFETDRDEVVRHVCHPDPIDFGDMVKMLGVGNEVTLSEFEDAVMFDDFGEYTDIVRGLAVSQLDGDGVGNSDFMFCSKRTMIGRDDVPELDNGYMRRLLRHAKDVKFM